MTLHGHLQHSAIEEGYPIVACPKCGDEQVDYDGFGFIACIPGCGYCTHPSKDCVDGRQICGICQADCGAWEP